MKYLTRLLSVALLATMVVTVKMQEVLYGSQIIGTGWSFRNGGSQINAKDAGKPVFDLRYDKGNKIREKGIDYIYPDNANVYPLGDHVLNKTSSIYSSYHEVISESMRGWGVSVGIDVGKYAIDGGYSHTEYDMHHRIEIEDKSAALGSYTSSIYRIVGPWYVVTPLNPDLRMAFDMLPSVPRTQQDLYLIQSIIDTWGEMFVASADFGLKLQYAAYLDKKYVEDTQLHIVSDQFSISLRKDMFNITARYDDVSGDLTIDKKFAEATQTEMYFTGGDRTKQSKNSLIDWDDSLDYSNAQVIRAQLVLLSNLISWDPIKRKELEAILIRYCNQGILQASNGVVFSRTANKANGAIEQMLIPTIPGASLIGSTFDPIKMTYGPNIIYPLPIRETWTNPIHANISFVVPGTVYVQNAPESYEYNNVFFSHSYLDYTYQMEKQSTNSYAFGLGKHTHYEYQYLRHVWSDTSIGIRQSQMLEWYKLSLSPKVASNVEAFLLPEIRNYIMSLPCGKTKDQGVAKIYTIGKLTYSVVETDEDPLYDELVASLGPEVIVDVRMGGGINLNVVVEQEILNYLDINAVVDHSGIDLKFLKSGDTDEKIRKDINAYYKKFSKTFVDVNGGYWNERNRTDVQPWESYKRTIADSPQPIEKRSVPLSYFVRDACRKKAILSAIHRYYSK